MSHGGEADRSLFTNIQTPGMLGFIRTQALGVEEL